MDLTNHPLANSRPTPSPEVRVAQKSWEDTAAWTTVGSDGIGGTLGQSAAGMRARKAFTRTLTPEEQFCVSVAVNAAIRAYTSNIPRAKLRFFTPTGEEIVGGDVVELFKRPFPGMTLARWMERMIASLLIRGEMAARKDIDGGGLVFRMAPLWPTRLRVDEPTKLPRFRANVARWRYLWPDGEDEKIADDRLLFDTEFNPDAASVRGLSRLEVAGIVTTAQHQSEVYEASFFANGASPSGVLNIGENVGHAQMADFDRKWHAKFGGAENAHKLAIASGKGLDFIPIEQPFQGGQFMELQQRIDGQVGQIFHVPPIMMGGVLAETRFKTAPEEKKQFADSALIPMMERLSEAFQLQIVDPHFRGSRVTRKRPRGKKPNTDENGNKYFSKSMADAFDKAVADRPDSGIIVLYDSDTLPIMPESKLALMEHAKSLQQLAKLNANDTCEWFGIELPDADATSDARTHVYVENNIIDLTDPKANEQFVPGLKDKPAAPDGGGEGKPPSKTPTAKPKPKKTLDPTERLRLDKAYSVLRKLRRLTLDKLMNDGDGELWGLSDGDALNTDNDREVWREIRRVRHQLAEAAKAAKGDREKLLSAAKCIFNGIDKPHLRKALGL